MLAFVSPQGVPRTPLAPAAARSSKASGASTVQGPSPSSLRCACAAAAAAAVGARRGRRTALQQEPGDEGRVVVEELEATNWGEGFNWAKNWYPLAVVEDLDPTRPNKLELLAEDLVAWVDGEGVWRVFEDRCPHRNVPLSEGRVEKDGTLMCSYHGWRFAGSGDVTCVPQATAVQNERVKTNPRACAASRPTQVRLGVLWVWGESGKDAALEAALKEPNLATEAEDPALKDKVTTSVWSHRDVPYGWEVAMENVTDPAHVAVAHHNVVSNRYKDPTPLKIEWVRKPSNQEGFCFQIIRVENPTDVVSTMDFRPPCQMHIRSQYPTGASLTLLINFVPTKPGWSRLVGSTMMILGEKGEKPPGFAIYSAPLPRFLVHLLAPVFLHQDQVFLHFQQTILQKQGLKGKGWQKSYWIPTEADKGTVALRRWLDKNGGVAWSQGACSDLTAMPSKELLFDTFKTHTCQCRTCSRALKVTETAHSALKVSSLLLASAGISGLSWPLLLGGGLLGAGAAATGKLKRMFHEVPFHHQDNN